jgi:hypothetical protein
MDSHTKRGVMAVAATVAAALAVGVAMAAWVRGSAAPDDRPVPGGKTVATGSLRAPIGAPLPPMPDQPAAEIPAHFRRRMGWDRRLEVAVDGHQVAVAGSAHVFDRVGDECYTWSLRIFGDSKEKPLIRECHYERLTFWPEPGQTEMRPEFRDSFVLPAGAYKVELSLYHAPPNFNFGKRKPGEDLRMITGGRISDMRRIWVGE